MSKSNIIQLWKENNVRDVVLTFSAGGDSMGDMEWAIYNKDNETIDCQELEVYFESEVFKEVEFYEVSDGQYMGEFGEVTITLEEDEDEEDGGIFVYDKEAQSEYEESFFETATLELSDTELVLLETKIDNINGGGWDNEGNINYKDDCVITDEEDEVLQSLVEKIKSVADNHEFEFAEGDEQDESRTYDTGDNGEGCEIDGNVLQIQVSARFYIVKSE
jgi:hypothetical protein